ncbi:MAG TPA: PaaI family thioesterase [Arenibaculum sp.]|nr:PaaI family thioesterase [Arenibaculum sp.]
MNRFAPPDPDFAARVRDSFARHAFLRLIGAELVETAPGICTIAVRVRADLCQQHGFIHAGVTATIADTAAGYAAFSLMPAGSSVLTTEFKINLMAPARGARLVARAEVLKPGRTLTVASVQVHAETGGERTCIAAMLASLICLKDTADTAPPA